MFEAWGCVRGCIGFHKKGFTVEKKDVEVFYGERESDFFFYTTFSFLPSVKMFHFRSSFFLLLVLNLLSIRLNSVLASLRLYELANLEITQTVEEIEVVPRVAAAFVILIRNRELEEWLETMKQVEARFNHKYNYPYVFLNDVPFTEEFKKGVQEVASGIVEFGQLSHESWSYPPWISQSYAKECRERMRKENVPYGASESYHFMCRYESGYFFRHPLMEKYDYYWRVEAGVTFHCDIHYDPFAWMQVHKKKYSFVISLGEFMSTIPTLWDTVKQFMKKHPEHIKQHNSLDFISNDGGETYNGSHFWSNFEIGDLNFFRSQPYLEYFDFLDRAGGFFYERWGDAPVHSIAAALLLEPQEIHFFSDFGYHHPDILYCPPDAAIRKCSCSYDDPHNEKTNVLYGTGRFLKLQQESIKKHGISAQ